MSFGFTTADYKNALSKAKEVENFKQSVETETNKDTSKNID